MHPGSIPGEASNKSMTWQAKASARRSSVRISSPLPPHADDRLTVALAGSRFELYASDVKAALALLERAGRCDKLAASFLFPVALAAAVAFRL